MIRDEQGSMSAFLAMLFLVFLLLISVCVEGIYMYTARGKAMGIYMSGLSHTKGNYQKELADMYHIYAMDPRYHKKIETDFSDRMKESLDQNGDPFRFQTGSTKISDILDLSAQKGEVLKYQIRQQMQYEAAEDILKNLTKKIRAGEDQKNEFSGIKDQIQKEEEEAEETENEKTLTSEPVKKDPRKGFMKLLKEGSVPLIMGEKKVSDLPINIVYGKKDTTKQSAWNFMNRKDVEKELDEFEKTASTDSFASELPAVLYPTATASGTVSCNVRPRFPALRGFGGLCSFWWGLRSAGTASSCPAPPAAKAGRSCGSPQPPRCRTAPPRRTAPAHPR